jgi:hypothetical protein
MKLGSDDCEETGGGRKRRGREQQDGEETAGVLITPKTDLHTPTASFCSKQFPSLGRKQVRSDGRG